MIHKGGLGTALLLPDQPAPTHNVAPVHLPEETTRPVCTDAAGLRFYQKRVVGQGAVRQAFQPWPFPHSPVQSQEGEEGRAVFSGFFFSTLGLPLVMYWD